MVKVTLVEYVANNNNETVTSSGLLFSEKFILITGHLLLPFLKQFNLDQWLKNLTVGIIHYNIFEQNRPKINVITKNEHVTSKRAEVIAGFVCKNIMNSCKKYLKNWAVEFENNTFHSKELLSLFFILEISDNTKNKLNLNEVLVSLLHSAGNFMPSTGHEVFIESVPFGNRMFLNSYSQGIVSNVIGENSCFLLTDCPSAPGSEGSPVFLKTHCKSRVAVAIVISCVNWWKGEWVGLTLTANLVPMLVQFNEFCSYTIQDSSSLVSLKLIGIINNCLVQVTNGSLWGTAILINKQKGIFLTNSHVITSTEILLHWKTHQIEASLIYKTPNAEAYDLAILKCNPSYIVNLSIVQATISLTPAGVGENVFSAGYPLFQSLLNPQPTVTKGNISQVYRGMLNTTCCVLPGTSGGAIFRSNGSLVAVVVSNVKINETGVAYPRVNNAIPIISIYSIIQEFLATEEVGKLHLLHSKDSNIIREWNYFSSKL